jgi:hypothetical protein
MAEQNWFLKYTQGTRRGNEREGVLMRIEDNEHSRYEFEIWFEYTRHAMNDIREGTMLVVPNYASTKDEQHGSVLEVTSIKPIHYAIGEKPEGFPGFVLEAAKNAAIDWSGQDDEPTEDTTTIRCAAIPTNLELLEDKDGRRTFENEANIPMVGTVARILDTEPTKQVVNRNIKLESEGDTLIEGGTLIRDSNVPIYVRIEEFLRLHFGVFGFTGSGKSNLLSTYVSKLVNSKVPVKIVLFDLLGEYTGLLIDLLNDSAIERARVIALGERTLPGPVVRFLKQERNGPDVDTASEHLARITLLPSSLQPKRAELTKGLKKLLEDGKLKIFSEVENLTVYYLFWDWKNNCNCPAAYKRRNKQALKDRKKEIIKRVVDSATKEGRDFTKKPRDFKAMVLSKPLAQDLLDSLRSELENPENKDVAEDFDGVVTQITTAMPRLDNATPASISESEILTDLNDEDSKASLYIITSHDPDEIRNFANRIGEQLYETRRQAGSINPTASLIFDEADEFIPQEAKGSQERSKEIIRTLARRGRKFGIGIGLATQRVRYLDTSIMAQPHTYLVSKLPRQTDRDVVAEAFGVSSDMFRQTFKFKPGNWLIMSHDATGLKAIPVPIQLEDANERISKFLATLK